MAFGIAITTGIEEGNYKRMIHCKLCFIFQTNKILLKDRQGHDIVLTRLYTILLSSHHGTIDHYWLRLEIKIFQGRHELSQKDDGLRLFFKILISQQFKLFSMSSFARDNI